jgi:hypothetical protein
VALVGPVHLRQSQERALHAPGAAAAAARLAATVAPAAVATEAKKFQLLAQTAQQILVLAAVAATQGPLAAEAPAS